MDEKLTCVIESHRVLAARAHVEGNPHHIHTQMAGRLEEGKGGWEVGTEFGPEAADGLRVVGEDAQHHLGVGVDGLDLCIGGWVGGWGG